MHSRYQLETCRNKLEIHIFKWRKHPDDNKWIYFFWLDFNLGTRGIRKFFYRENPMENSQSSWIIIKSWIKQTDKIWILLWFSMLSTVWQAGQTHNTFVGKSFSKTSIFLVLVKVLFRGSFSECFYSDFHGRLNYDIVLSYFYEKFTFWFSLGFSLWENFLMSPVRGWTLILWFYN